MKSVEIQASNLRYGAHVRANNIRQHYLRYGGTGQPLVLVPGITSPAALWGFVAERLSLRFDTYVLDVRGRGLSEAGAHLNYGLDACAADLNAFAEALQFKEYKVLGHSMGGRIAIRAARTASASLGELVLVDPPVGGPGRRPYPIPLASMLDLVAAAKRGEAEALLRAPGARAWPEDLLRLRAEWLHTCDERAVVESYQGFHNDNIHADLPLIKAGIALIAAGKGGVILSEEERELRCLVPSMHVIRVIGAGHQIPVDDFDGFFAALECVFKVAF